LGIVTFKSPAIDGSAADSTIANATNPAIGKRIMINHLSGSMIRHARGRVNPPPRCVATPIRYNIVMARTPAARKTPKRGLTTPRGFRAAAGTCGIKPSGHPDLALIVADRPAVAAGMFTTNKVAGAPVIISKRHVRNATARAIVCNSGVANVCTGEQGIQDAIDMCRHTAAAVGCEPGDVLVCSTGVIGPRLPIDKIQRGIPVVAHRLARGPNADRAAARGILTTDLVPKTAYKGVRLGGKLVHIAGIAKGSGMIAPHMATMLAFITTDAAIAPAQLKAALRQATSASFNRISVDTDTSTSDSVLILASGAARNRKLTAAGDDYRKFADALTEVCQSLAYQIIKDGEGATKVFRLEVRGARGIKDADLVGRAVVGSPLVKTAVHGSDPNWGRILAAAGRSGAHVNPDKLNLTIGDQPVLQHGQPLELNITQQRNLARIMKRREITFTLDLQVGKATADWLGCDLSKQYVTINADYTT
jgi:glutamate N-acetyltransferase/amino-acid N-acetyltransferase